MSDSTASTQRNTAPSGQAQLSSDETVGSKRSRRLLWFGIFIALVLIGAIFAVAFHRTLEARKDEESRVQQRQNTIVASRVELADAWLKSLTEPAARFVDSDIVKMYASDVDSRPGALPLLFKKAPEDAGSGAADDMSSGISLLRSTLVDFVDLNKYLSGRLVNSKADPYISTEAVMEPLNAAEKAGVQQVVNSGRIFFAPLEATPRGLVLEMYFPIMPPQYQKQNAKPVAVLILMQRLDIKLAELLSPGVAEEKGRTLSLVQRNGDVFQNVVPGATHMRPAQSFDVKQDEPLPFGLRGGIAVPGEVYSSGMRLRAVDWWIVAENDATLIRSMLAENAKTIYLLAGLMSLALVLLFSAVWWRLVGQEQSTINTQITSLLSVIREQEKLLNGINSTITDPISLTDGKGIYRYVNKAFAAAVGRSPEDVTGLDGPAVFGFDTAKRLNASDQHVLMTGESISVHEVLWLQSKRYYFQISKAPLRESGSRAPQGIVSVFRDISQLVETQERSRRVVQQTIDALVRTIEEADPFLGGHSRIMGGMAALMARQLRLSDTDVATIEAAANLSQIGKMFVPRDILLKPGVLTPEEKKEMERHVEYTRNVLKDIEFDLPVLPAIYQLNERLDGRGYPQGLSGDEISIHARVLSVANAFTAMAKPRSYRPALPVEDVLAILEKQQGDSYDPEVIVALRQVIATPAGERLVQQAASSKAL